MARGALRSRRASAKATGHGDVAERAARRRFERHVGDDRIVGGQAVQAPDGLGHAGANELMDRKNHRRVRHE